MNVKTLQKVCLLSFIAHDEGLRNQIKKLVHPIERMICALINCSLSKMLALSRAIGSHATWDAGICLIEEWAGPRQHVDLKICNSF